MDSKKERAIRKAIKKMGSDAPKRALAREAGVNRGTLQKYLEEQGLEAPKSQITQMDETTYKYLKDRLSMPDWLIDQFNERFQQDKKAALKLIMAAPELKGGGVQMTPRVQKLIFYEEFMQTGDWSMWNERPPEWLIPSIRTGRYYDKGAGRPDEIHHCQECGEDTLFWITDTILITRGETSHIVQCQKCQTEYMETPDGLEKFEDPYRDTAKA